MMEGMLIKRVLGQTSDFDVHHSFHHAPSGGVHKIVCMSRGEHTDFDSFKDRSSYQVSDVSKEREVLVFYGAKNCE